MSRSINVGGQVVRPSSCFGVTVQDRGYMADWSEPTLGTCPALMSHEPDLT